MEYAASKMTDKKQKRWENKTGRVLSVKRERRENQSNKRQRVKKQIDYIKEENGERKTWTWMSGKSVCARDRRRGEKMC